MTDVLNMESAKLSPCYADPNFAIICGFFEKFGKMCGVQFPLSSELVLLLECEEGVPEELATLHVQLLRKIRKSTTIDKWERTVVKFCRSYLPDDADELDAKGYLGCSLDLKLRLLRTLLETQFDLNVKFKAAVNLLTAEELREKPIGRDTVGRLYWGLLDAGANMKIFREDIGDENSWSVVASDRNSLVQLLYDLSGDNTMDLAPIIEPPAPVIDTGQDSSESEDGDDENNVLSEGTTEEDDDEEVSPEKKLKISEETTEEEGGSVAEKDNDENDFPKNIKSSDTNELHSKKSTVLEEEDKYSEAIEDPVVIVKGDGNGQGCEAGPPLYFECSEPIEEDVFFVWGEGNGSECSTGNPKEETKQDGIENNQMNTNAAQASGIGSSIKVALSNPQNEKNSSITGPVENAGEEKENPSENEKNDSITGSVENADKEKEKPNANEKNYSITVSLENAEKEKENPSENEKNDSIAVSVENPDKEKENPSENLNEGAVTVTPDERKDVGDAITAGLKENAVSGIEVIEKVSEVTDAEAKPLTSSSSESPSNVEDKGNSIENEGEACSITEQVPSCDSSKSSDDAIQNGSSSTGELVTAAIHESTCPEEATNTPILPPPTIEAAQEDNLRLTVPAIIVTPTTPEQTDSLISDETATETVCENLEKENTIASEKVEISCAENELDDRENKLSDIGSVTEIKNIIESQRTEINCDRVENEAVNIPDKEGTVGKSSFDVDVPTKSETECKPASIVESKEKQIGPISELKEITQLEKTNTELKAADSGIVPDKMEFLSNAHSPGIGNKESDECQLNVKVEKLVPDTQSNPVSSQSADSASCEPVEIKKEVPSARDLVVTPTADDNCNGLVVEGEAEQPKLEQDKTADTETEKTKESRCAVEKVHVGEITEGNKSIVDGALETKQRSPSPNLTPAKNSKSKKKAVIVPKTRSLRSRSNCDIKTNTENEAPTKDPTKAEPAEIKMADSAAIEENDPLATPPCSLKGNDEDPLAIVEESQAKTIEVKKETRGRPKKKVRPKKQPKAVEPDEADEDIIKPEKKNLKNNESKQNENSKAGERKEPFKKPGNYYIPAREVQLLGVTSLNDENQSPVRQSRRIAQIRMKEDAERRQKEEEELKAFKKGGKKGKDGIKKKGKKKSGDDEDYEGDDVDEDDEEEERRPKKEKKFKFNDKNPWQSSSESSEQEEEAEPEEDEIEEEPDPVFKSDHEFSPESDIEDPEYQPVRVARTAHNRKETPQEKYDDVSCEICKASDKPEWILLCDDCDKGTHTECLKPPLHIVPEGEWYCPPCSLLRLIAGLKKTLRDYDRCEKQRENEALRKKRLAFVGISLDNVLPAKKVKKPDVEKVKDSDSESEFESGSDSDRSENSSDSGPIYQLRERRSNVSSYRYNEYDEMIRSAIRDEIREGSKEEAQLEKEKIKENVSNESRDDENEGDNDGEKNADESEELDEIPAVVPRKRQPKKKKKLTSLEFSSEEEDRNSDSDFQGSSEEEEEDEDLSESDLSGEPRRGRGKASRRVAVRRSARAKRRRFDRDFINDDSTDVSDVPSPPAKSYGSSESSDSDRSWGRPKGRKSNRRRALTPPRKQKKKQKKKSLSDDSEEDKPKKKRRVKYGLDSDDDKVINRRTRGRQINYIVDNEASDSDSDGNRKKKMGSKKKSDESDVEFNAEDEKSEEEEEMDDINEEDSEDDESEDEIQIKVHKTDKKILKPLSTPSKRKASNDKNYPKKKAKQASESDDVSESDPEEDLESLDDEAEEKLMNMLDKGDMKVDELKAAVKKTKEEAKVKEPPVEKKKSKVKITPTRAELAEREANVAKLAAAESAGGLLMRTLQSERSPAKPEGDGPSVGGIPLAGARQGRPPFPSPIAGPFTRPVQAQHIQPSPLQMMSALGPQPPAPHPVMAPHDPKIAGPPPVQMTSNIPPHHVQLGGHHGNSPNIAGMQPQVLNMNRQPSMGSPHPPSLHQMTGAPSGVPFQPNAPFPPTGPSMQQPIRPPMGQSPPGVVSGQHRPLMPTHNMTTLGAVRMPPTQQQPSGMTGPQQPPHHPMMSQPQPGVQLGQHQPIIPQSAPSHLPMGNTGNQNMTGGGQFTPQGAYPGQYPNPSSSPNFQSSPEPKQRKKPGPKPGSKNKKKTEEELQASAGKKGRVRKPDDVTIATVQAPTQFPDANAAEGGSVITRMLNASQGTIPVSEPPTQYQNSPPTGNVSSFGPTRTLDPSPSGGGPVLANKPTFNPDNFPPYQNFQQPFTNYPSSPYHSQQSAPAPAPAPSLPQPLTPALGSKSFEEEEASEFGGLASYFASQAEEEMDT